MVTSTTSECVVIKQLFCITHERVSKCVVILSVLGSEHKGFFQVLQFHNNNYSVFFHKGDI
jgi:hypothetical protein